MAEAAEAAAKGLDGAGVSGKAKNQDAAAGSERLIVQSMSQQALVM